MTNDDTLRTALTESAEGWGDSRYRWWADWRRFQQPMTDEYTPTTAVVRAIYGRTPLGAKGKATEEAFNRWLESEREAARQEVRERIAQDIEAIAGDDAAYVREHAARIARGATR